MYFKVPDTPVREELGIQLARATDTKKRNIKLQEKAAFDQKLRYTPLYKPPQ